MKIKLTNYRYLIRKRLPLCIMRVFIFLLCATVFGFNPNTSFSQEKVFINQNQSVSVDEMFNIIQQQTNYHFIFPKKLFKDSPTIQLEQGEVLVISLLDRALKNSSLEFEIDENNTILIKKVDHTYDRRQQKVKVSGTITDATGMPLAGVTVLEKGTRNGVATDFNGVYSISVADNAVLEFTYVGFIKETKEVSALTYYSNVDVTLKEDVNALQEVVVTGYQTLSRERTTGSFAQVGAEQLQQRPSSTNIIDRIIGQIPSVNINNAFGQGTFEIRGRGSVLSSNTSPLIVVDGFPLADQSNLESINPEDVETITVLKDAAAASIWGSRAANGVVVVVTKRGGKNKALTVDASTFVDLEENIDLKNFNFMTTAQELALDQEYIDRGWTNINGLETGTASINDFHLAHIYRNGTSPDGVVWSQNTFDNYINELKKRDIDQQWSKYFLRTGTQKTYNLSLSGGGERNAFFASLSYVDQNGAVIGDDNDRMTMNLRNTFDFNDKISFTAGMTAALRQQKDNYLTSRYGLDPIELVKLAQPYDQLVDENGQYIQKYYDWNPWMSQDREAELGVPYTYNALEDSRNRDQSSTLVDIRADFQLDIELFKDFVVSSSFRYERNTNDLDEFRSMNMPSWRNTVNDFYVYDSSTGNYQYGIPPGSMYLQERSYSKGWVFKNTINWDKTWDDHQLTVFAGGEYSRRFNESTRNRQFGYDKQSTSYLPIDEAALVGYRLTDWNGGRFYDYYAALVFNVTNRDNRFVSGFSNVGYTYQGKYTLNGSFRIDQANIFGSNPDFRYKPLWSVGLGWDLNKESFMSNASWIDRLKLRGTYGLAGNSLTGVYPEAAARIRNITWGNVYNSLYLSQPANPDLKWEETATTNLGLDFAFFNDRLSGSFDYYVKKSTDVYTSRPIDPTVGFSTSRVNYANIDNKGVELVLNADIIRNDDFKWSVRANFNHNKNILSKSLIESNPTADGLSSGNAYVEGDAMGSFYAYNFAGLDDNGEVLLYDLDGNTKKWNDGTIMPEEMEYSGTRTAPHYGGLSNTFRYKGLDLTINMNYQAGHVFRMSYNYGSVGYGTYNNYDYDFGNIRMHKEWAKRWMQPGDEATTDVPGLISRSLTGTMHRIWSQSTRNTHKADYIRVQDIILGYSMPQQFLDKTFFKNLRLSMQVTNPFLWVKNDLGVDPTAPNSEAYMNLTRYTLGVRASF